MATQPVSYFNNAANVQADSSAANVNKQTQANRPNQMTPFGSVNWTQDPATGAWTQNTSLSGQQQGSLDAQQGVQYDRSKTAQGMGGQVNDAFSTPIDYSKFASGGTSATAGPTLDPSSKYYQTATDAISGKFNDLMNPQFAQDEERMDTTLRNRGLKPGDAAYEQGLQQLRQAQNQAREQSNYQAIIGGGAEASRMLNMDDLAAKSNLGRQIDAGTYNTNLRGSQINEELLRRSTPLNEQNALLSGQSVQNPEMPSFASAGLPESTQAIRAAEAEYGKDVDSDNARNALIGQGLDVLPGVVGALGKTELGQSIGSAVNTGLGKVGLGGLFGGGTATAGGTAGAAAGTAGVAGASTAAAPGLGAAAASGVPAGGAGVGAGGAAGAGLGATLANAGMIGATIAPFLGANSSRDVSLTGDAVQDENGNVSAAGSPWAVPGGGKALFVGAGGSTYTDATGKAYTLPRLNFKGTPGQSFSVDSSGNVKLGAAEKQAIEQMYDSLKKQGAQVPDKAAFKQSIVDYLSKVARTKN